MFPDVFFFYNNNVELTMTNESINKRWQQYYQLSAEIKHRPNTEMAVKLNQSGIKIAIDCGCGVGADTAYLAKQGYTVHAFDNSVDAINLCKQRFDGDTNIHLTTANFETYHYPTTGIMVANSSLFFSDKNQFAQTWQSICNSIAIGGVFTGDFLGIKDDWANNFEIATNPLNGEQVTKLFTGFDIIHFKERDEVGYTRQGEQKHWHVFSILAIKNG